MSLFNETVARAAKAEADLAMANKRIADLEKALANSRKVNALAIKRGLDSGPYTPRSGDEPYGTRKALRDLNSLTDEEVEQQFVHIEEQQARMAEAEDAASLKLAVLKDVPVRSRLLAPIAALFQRVTK